MKKNLFKSIVTVLFVTFIATNNSYAQPREVYRGYWTWADKRKSLVWLLVPSTGNNVLVKLNMNGHCMKPMVDLETEKTNFTYVAPGNNNEEVAVLPTGSFYVCESQSVVNANRESSCSPVTHPIDLAMWLFLPQQSKNLTPNQREALREQLQKEKNERLRVRRNMTSEERCNERAGLIEEQNRLRQGLLARESSFKTYRGRRLPTGSKQ